MNVTDFDHFVRFLCSKVTLFLPFPYYTPSHCMQPKPRSEEQCAPSLRVEHLHKQFGNLLHERFVFLSLLIYSIIYLYQMDSWIFISWVIIKYYCILLLKLFHLLSLGALSVGSCVSLTYTHQCSFLFAFLSIFLLLSTKRHSRPILYMSCPTGIAICLKRIPFTGQWY